MFTTADFWWYFSSGTTSSPYHSHIPLYNKQLSTLFSSLVYSINKLAACRREPVGDAIGCLCPNWRFPLCHDHFLFPVLCSQWVFSASHSTTASCLCRNTHKKLTCLSCEDVGVREDLDDERMFGQRPRKRIDFISFHVLAEVVSSFLEVLFVR